MPYINNDGDSRLNNFPVEPKMYVSEAKNPNQSRNYLIVSVIGLVLAIGLILVARTI